MQPTETTGDEKEQRQSNILADLLERPFSRRSLLAGTLATVPLVALARIPGAGASPVTAPAPAPAGAPEAAPSGAATVGPFLTFDSVPLVATDTIQVARGYEAKVLIAWGDSLFPGTPSLTGVAQLTLADQARQLGYNVDFISYHALPNWKSQRSDWGVLAINLEYTNPELMFLRYDAGNPTRDQVDIEIAAHGMAFVEVRRSRTKGWTYSRNPQYNRRITGNTPTLVTGPAAGSSWLKTSADSAGTRVLGTLNNCGGGWTPWGTVLTAEENFNQYFGQLSKLPDTDRRKAYHTRYGVNAGDSERKWERFHDRFDVSKEPNEPFRFGWIVEIDPYDPHFVPRKRTALGRTKHEAATTTLAPDGRVVIYSGDDERFDYVYKFVTSRKFNANDRASNMDLLDEGILYVARYEADGTGTWIPMVAGRGPLTEANGFRDQADVVVLCRQAADLLGATKMDRPEDIERNPVSGRVYAVFTNNNRRGTSGMPATDDANPRGNNIHGHILEMTEAGDDAAATRFSWNIFMLCGDPAKTADNAFYAGAEPTDAAMVSTPDNIAFDNVGNLWIATDGQPSSLRMNDAIVAVPTEGPERGMARRLFTGVLGGEVAGPCFTPDNSTLFVSVQHPGEGGSLNAPVSHWPSGQPPRPAIVAITKSTPGAIGA